MLPDDRLSSHRLQMYWELTAMQKIRMRGPKPQKQVGVSLDNLLLNLL